MQRSLKIFDKKRTRRTEEGIVNRELRRYFTHRDYHGDDFKVRIPKSEIEIAKYLHADHIVVKYHGKKRNLFFKFPIEYLRYVGIDDDCYEIKFKDMELIGEEIE